MALYPGAILKLITSKQRRPMAAYNRLNAHIAVSEAASLFGFFSGVGNADSHFYVRRGTPEQIAALLPATVEQYVDTAHRANADLEGNDGGISVETQGGVSDAQNEPWDISQLIALAQILLWVHTEHDIPLKLATDSMAFSDTSRGLSCHRLGIDPWRVAGGMRYSKSRGKVCPGNVRVGQLPGILATATGSDVVHVDNPIIVAPIPLPAPVPVPAPRTWLQRGDTGAAVVELQNLLNREDGADLTADGIYMARTEAAVREYQGDRGLVIDGIAGDATLAALRSSKPSIHTPAPVGVLQVGSRGADVAEVQRRLRDGYPAYAKKLVPDGIFGAATRAVVVEFQRRSGLVADGIVGQKTRSALGL